MGEKLRDSRCYILQCWSDYYDRWLYLRCCCSLKEAKQDIARMKSFNKNNEVKLKYRIIKETAKQEVVYGK